MKKSNQAAGQRADKIKELYEDLAFTLRNVAGFLDGWEYFDLARFWQTDNSPAALPYDASDNRRGVDYAMENVQIFLDEISEAERYLRQLPVDDTSRNTLKILIILNHDFSSEDLFPNIGQNLTKNEHDDWIDKAGYRLKIANEFYAVEIRNQAADFEVVAKRSVHIASQTW